MLKTLKCTLSLLASLCIFSNVFAQKENTRVKAYIEKYKDLAMAEMVRTGIPASITLAQGLLETGFGQSDLAQHANNHFGIKCKGDWKGETMLHDDDAKGECFRKYPSVEDSYKDHSDFLKNRPHYAFLFSIDPTDYKGWAYGLKKAGYATSPTYPQRLIKYIEDNNLHEYTLLAMNKAAGENGDIVAEVTVREKETKEIEAKQEDEAETSTLADAVVETMLEPKAEAVEDNQYPKDKQFVINNSKVIYATPGTSLFAVAANYEVTYVKLLEFNELPKVDILEKGQLIFLERKQRKGEKDVHVVQENENLYDIAQKEGIQLATMLEYNRLTKDSKTTAGQKLYLKATTPGSAKVATTMGVGGSAGTM